MVIDSVKLFLRIKSNYGSNDDFRHYLRISEISDMLYNNTEYYSDTHVNTTGFGVSAIIPELRNDTINSMEINLPISFGEYLIRDTSMLFYTTDTTKPDFRNYFKGIHITIPSASAADPFLLGFNLAYAAGSDGYDVYTNYIEIYMHERDSIHYTYKYKFLLDSKNENARFTTIKHDFNTDIKNIVNNQIIDSLSYVQGLYGVYTTISIPELESIKKDPNRIRSAVNKAHLTVPVHLDNITYTDSTVAPRLMMRYVNALGVKDTVPDYFVDDYGGAYFGGRLDTAKHEYNFNLSRFVQSYLNDKEDKLKPEVEIFLPANTVLNTILKANNSKTRPKFELTLTNY
jgi:hypothetical protein